jgi:diacylglycerol kinase family enzyme
MEARIFVIASGDNISERARELLKTGYKTIVAAGGDGTVNAIAAVLVDTDAVLGVLPVGGLNHFAKDIGVPPDLEAAVRHLANGMVRTVDVGEVNGRIFVNNSGLGLYPLLVVERERRRRLGEDKWAAFLRASIETLRRFPFLHVRLTVEGREFARRTPFVFVGNNVYRMVGLRLGSRDSLTDGLLFLGVARRPIGRWGLIQLAFRALFGHIREERDLDLVVAKEIHITSRRRRVRVSLDGEVTRMATPLQYRTRPGALKVIAP